MKVVSANECSQFLNSTLVGENISIRSARSIDSIEEYSLIFLSKRDDVSIEKINKTQNVLCVATENISEYLTCSVVVHKNPRLAFSMLLQEFFVEGVKPSISSMADVHSSASIGNRVNIGPFCVIGRDVAIGDGTYISSNVVIEGNVTIGENCFIKSNTTIGCSGFGFTKNTEGVAVAFPHVGSVVVGDNVEIGANCTVVRGTLDATKIGDGVKTDDHVHIAHNCVIGKNTFLAASVVLCGSCNVGAEVWISPNSTVIDYCTVGDGAFIGLGSVVRKPIAKQARVFGVPAKPIGLRKR